MSVAFFALIASIVSASNLDIAGASFGAQLGTLAAALGLLAVSLEARRADYDHYLRATAWVRWVPFVLPILIGVQLLPMWLSLAHPIWTSARDALGGLPIGYVTADFGLTLSALALALTAVALFGTTVIVARNRGRAELILFVLSAVTAISALLFDLQRVVPSVLGATTIAAATTLAGIGLMLNLAVMQLAAERAETHHALSRSIAIGLCGMIGAVVCAFAVFGLSDPTSATGAGFGVVIVLLILMIRRLDLSSIAATSLSVAALVGAAIVIAFMFEKNAGAGPALLRFVPELPAGVQPAFERMLADTRWLGAGAGSFSMVGRIYQSDAETLLAAPSAAIAAFADMGWIGLCALIVVGLALLVRLFFGGLQRGRDSFFPAAAAGCICFALVDGFAGRGLLEPASILWLSVLVGLGLSQSVSQSGR